MEYNKLVRDKIPDIIAKNGKKASTHIASPEEYDNILREKLKEEVMEFYESGEDEEIADILEVIHAISDFRNRNISDFEELRKKKAEERGSFSKMIILDRVED